MILETIACNSPQVSDKNLQVIKLVLAFISQSRGMFCGEYRKVLPPLIYGNKHRRIQEVSPFFRVMDERAGSVLAPFGKFDELSAVEIGSKSIDGDPNFGTKITSAQRWYAT